MRDFEMQEAVEEDLRWEVCRRELIVCEWDVACEQERHELKLASYLVVEIVHNLAKYISPDVLVLEKGGFAEVRV